MKTRTKKVVLGAALGLGACVVLALVLGMKRPEILSMGTVAFAAGCLTVGASALLLVVSLKSVPEEFSPGWTDRVYIIVVTWCWASYTVSTVHRGPVLQPFLVIAGLVVYLLVRAAPERFLFPRRTLWAWLLVVMVGIEALHGLRQFLSGVEMKGFFYNANYLAMFLALAVPPAVALAWLADRPALRLSAWAAAALFMACIVLTRCRTALAGVLIVAGLMTWAHYFRSKDFAGKRGSRRRVSTGLAFAGAAVLLIGLLTLSTKPMSAQGRVLVWKVSLRMFLAHPVLGGGFSSFAGLYDGAQGDYFRQGLGTPMERLSADSVAYAFNDYLEPAVELGLVGFFIFAGFWFLILKNILAAFPGARASGLGKPKADPEAEVLTMAAAGSVLVYMIMSFFYFPSRILPIVLLFNVLLAWVVSENMSARKVDGRASSGGRGLLSRRPGRHLNLNRGLVSGIALAGLLASLLLLPSFFGQFKAEQTWAKAKVLLQSGRNQEALDLSRSLYPHLRSNDNFLIYYSRLLMSQGRNDEAVVALERGIVKSSNPYLWEKLAEAYASTGNVEKARSCAFRADSVLPWRLTSKALLSDLYARQGDFRRAVHYARLVIDIPMKLRTDEGLVLKQKALDFWVEHRQSDTEAVSPKLEAVLLLSSQYRARALAALDAAGANAGQLIQVINALDPEERDGFGFLLVNMPDRDLKTLLPGFLTDDVTYAYRARRDIPWAKNIPDDIFLNYVLPYAVADEHRDDWRRMFYGLFRDKAAASGSFEEAVIGLNRDILLEFHLGYAERDNRKALQSPFEAIRAGTVSCGEASVLLIDACRAVGIPARLAILRRWAHLAGGHIWVEVYDRDHWRYLVAYDVNLLDRTWMAPFLKELNQADPQQHVYAVSFQKTDLHLMFGPFVSFVDVSQNYRNAQPEMK
jgi:O-antigen ligase/tetratricopeptide (TPR) repeat protein